MLRLKIAVLCLALVHTTVGVPSVASFRPDTSASYYSCPTCDVMAAPGNDIPDLNLSRVQEAINRFVGGLHDRNVNTVMKNFCLDAVLWGTVSHAIRTTPEQIRSYFDYFANEENVITGACTNVVTLDSSALLYTAHTAVQANGGCLRMSFTIQLSEVPGSTCIVDLYSSQFPNDPKELIEVDTDNEMPWTPYTEEKFLAAPATVEGSCSECPADNNNGVEAADLEEMKEVLDNWASALLANDAQGIADTYCASSPMLWGTVSNMRRHGHDQVKSYFDWFANSRDFADAEGPGIRSICSRYSKMERGAVWRDDRDVDLGGQCLRMSYFLTKENGKMCIKTLSSSYFPEEPAKLQSIDRINGMPWAGELSPMEEHKKAMKEWQESFDAWKESGGMCE